MSLWPVQNHSIKFIIMYVLSCFLLMFLQFSSRMCFLDSSWAIFEKSPSSGLSFVLLLRDAIFPSTVYDKLSFSLSRVGTLHQAVYFPFPFLFHGLSGICMPEPWCLWLFLNCSFYTILIITAFQEFIKSWKWTSQNVFQILSRIFLTLSTTSSCFIFTSVI